MVMTDPLSAQAPPSAPGQPMGQPAPAPLAQPSPPPPPKQKSPARRAQTSQSDADKALAQKVRGLFQESRTFRRTQVAKWNRNYRALRNRTWLSPQAHLPALEVPEMVPIVESLVGWLTDQRPTLDVIPAIPPFSTLADQFQTLADDLRVTLNVNWQQNDHETEIEMVVRDGFTYGTGILKTMWDNTLCNGQGDAVIRRIDPYAFYPDPGASSLRDANYMIEARRVSIQELDRRFPGAGALLAETRYNDTIDERPDLDNTSTTPKANPGPISPSTSSSYGLPGQSRESIFRDPSGVTILEAWMREHTTTTADDGTPSVKEDWRCVVVAGPHILLNELASDISPAPRHPYETYYMFANGEMWGQSMVELLLPSQIAINRLLSAAQHHIELTGNPVLLENTRSGTQRIAITNKPGQRLPVGDGGKVEWLNPPPMAPNLLDLIQFHISEMERASGLSAITRGMMPGGRNAASVMDSLQEASFVRVRMASRQLERVLKNTGERIAGYIVKFYTEPRMVSLIGQNGERTSRALKSLHWYIPEDDGSAPLKFVLQVQAGSSLPTSRQARAAEADSLFAMGAIDLMSLLQAHSWPNAQMVYQRKMAEMGVMQQAQQSQQSQQQQQ